MWINRQGQGETAALSWLALHFQAAAVRFSDLAGDAEAEAHALHDAAPLRAAVEGLEDFLLLALGDARTRIGDFQQQIILNATNGDVDLPTRRGELDGVAEQVAERLGQAVGVDLDLRQVGLDLQRPGQPFFTRWRPPRAKRFPAASSGDARVYD